MPLEEAGFAYACLQTAGVVARVVLGWLANRTGRPAHNLTVQAYVAAVLLVVFARLPDDVSFELVVVICAAVGFVGVSWNGIYLAEVARLAPPARVAEATSASLPFTFVEYIVGPAVLTWLVETIGGWHLPFLIISAQLAAMAMGQTMLLMRGRLVGS